MKKILIGLFTLLLSSCSMYNGICYLNWYQIDMSRLPKFSNIEEIKEWIVKNITYNTLSEGLKIKSHCRLPQEVLDTRLGDCKEMSLLLIAIAYNQMNIFMDLVDMDGHCATVYENIIYDCALNITKYYNDYYKEIKFPLEKIYGFYEIWDYINDYKQF